MTDFTKKYQPNPLRPYVKPPKTEKKKPKGISRFRKPTGEKPVFEKIWNSRPHKSEIGGESIQDPTPTNFLHVLPKGKNKFPEFKLDPENIVLGTEDEHFIWDNARHLANPNSPEWQFMYNKELQLLNKYKKLHG